MYWGGWSFEAYDGGDLIQNNFWKGLDSDGASLEKRNQEPWSEMIEWRTWNERIKILQEQMKEQAKINKEQQAQIDSLSWRESGEELPPSQLKLALQKNTTSRAERFLFQSHPEIAARAEKFSWSPNVQHVDTEEERQKADELKIEEYRV